MLVLSVSRPIAVGVLALALAGCGRTTEPTPPTLTGNYAGRRLFGYPEVFTLALREVDGAVTGRAWSPINQALIRGATVVGTLNGSRVALRIFRADPPIDEWQLDGEFVGDTVRGSFEPTHGFPVEFVRVDTVATALGSLDVQGDTTGSGTGTAVLDFASSALLLSTDPPFRVVVQLFFRVGRGMPPAGDYPVAPSGPGASAQVLIGGASGGEVFNGTGGTIKVERSTRYAVFGRFDFHARSAAGRNITTVGAFSAACAGIC